MQKKIMVMANSRVFNFAILLKSRKFDAREIYVLQYIVQPKLCTLLYSFEW